MDIRETVKRQKEYFETGETRDLDFRRRALKALRKGIRTREEEVLAALEQDLGKSSFEAYATELGMVYEEISYMLKHLSGLAAPRRVRTPLISFPAKSAVYREPYGLVLIMSPWNYPFQLAMVPLVGALAAGNCAVVKPSAYAPAVSAVIAEILADVFPPEHVSAVTGGREANRKLLDEKFDYIFFTGGKEVGRTVMEAAAVHLTPVTLELGGKSPCIVDETADIPMAARRIVWGKFLNSGQTCVAPDYILVHSSVKQRLLRAIVRNIEALYGSDPLASRDYSRIVNRKHFDRLQAMVEGEELYYDGGSDPENLRMGPAVIADADWDCKAMADEIFGPVLPVLEFSSLKQVKEQICARPRPLALYLFTSSAAAKRYVIRNIPFGGGCINDTIMHLATTRMPFGGIGESGMGNYHGSSSFRTFSHEKSILSRGSLVDIPMRYPPYGDSLRLLRMLMK